MCGMSLLKCLNLLLLDKYALEKSYVQKTLFYPIFTIFQVYKS